MKSISIALPRFPVQPATAGVIVAMAGVVTFAAATMAGPASVWRLATGVLVSVALGWLVSELLRQTIPLLETPTTALSLRALPEPCRELVSSLLVGVSHADPVFRELMQTQMAALSEQVREWSHGQLAFTGTEAWRTAYQKVLTSPDVTEYRSVAWVKTEDYWQDLPGQQSSRLNFDLIDQGMLIERVLILGWNLWPPELRLPREPIRRWIEDQHYRGVTVHLVRENDLVGEPDLLRDFGIYGDRAVGEQHVDGESRTVSFTFWFDCSQIELAKERWARLKLFGRPYAEILEPAAR